MRWRIQHRKSHLGSVPAFHLENNRPRELVLGDRQGSAIHWAAAYRDPPFQGEVRRTGPQQRALVAEVDKMPHL